MALHIEYRPKKLKEVAGNESVVKMIGTMLKRDVEEIPRTWLFHGPSGCGKTTLARIVSGILGCAPNQNNQDFREINASNNRGIDTARDILKTMKFMPMDPNNTCRVYLLDEVHQGTKDFQNSLLKVLEDTPDHIYFLLCTTDPGKLLPTIRNRCSMFEVKPLRDGQVKKLVEYVLEEEGVDDVDDDAIKAIVATAEGCPRQAMVTLDQIIDLDPDEMVGAIKAFKTSEKQTIDLCRVLLNGNWAKTIAIVKELDGEPESVRRAVIGYMAAILIKQKSLDSKIAGQAMLVLDCFSENFFNTGKPGLVKACAEVFI